MIANPNSDPESCIAMQEMYIELKTLRRENLRLLDRDDLFNALVNYYVHSRAHHYLTPELEDLVTEIEDLADSANVPLEIDND